MEIFTPSYKLKTKLNSVSTGDKVADQSFTFLHEDVKENVDKLSFNHNT